MAEATRVALAGFGAWGRMHARAIGAIPDAEIVGVYCHGESSKAAAQAELPDDDMMALGARIRAYASTGAMGPLAIVAMTAESYERAHLFAALADAQRPIKIFTELHKARQWLDAQAPAD